MYYQLQQLLEVFWTVVVATFSVGRKLCGVVVVSCLQSNNMCVCLHVLVCVCVCVRLCVCVSPQILHKPIKNSGRMVIAAQLVFGRLSVQISTSHSHTVGMSPLNEWSVRHISRYLHNTQQKQQTDIHVLSGIRTHDPCTRAAADPCLLTARPLGPAWKELLPAYLG